MVRCGIAGCIDLFADALTVIALVRDDHFGRGELRNQFGSCSAVVDVASCDLESHRQILRINRQMNLAREPSAAFADCLRLTAGGTRTVLMSFHIGAVDERPLKVRLLKQGVENAEPLAGRPLGVDALVDRIPAPEGAGQVSPGQPTRIR